MTWSVALIGLGLILLAMDFPLAADDGIFSIAKGTPPLILFGCSAIRRWRTASPVRRSSLKPSPRSVPRLGVAATGNCAGQLRVKFLSLSRCTSWPKCGESGPGTRYCVFPATVLNFSFAFCRLALRRYSFESFVDPKLHDPVDQRK